MLYTVVLKAHSVFKLCGTAVGAAEPGCGCGSGFHAGAVPENELDSCAAADPRLDVWPGRAGQLHMHGRCGALPCFGF